MSTHEGSVVVMSARPTLLRVLAAQRHWQKFETFATQFGRAAEELADKDHDPKLRGLSIAKRQFTRWLAGAVQTKPYPDHCRVLEYLFGHSVVAIHQGWRGVAAGQRRHPHDRPRRPIARTVRGNPRGVMPLVSQG